MKKSILLVLALGATALAPASSLTLTGFVANQFRFVLTSFNGTSPLTNTQAGTLAATLDSSFNFNAYCVDSTHAPLIGTAYNTNMVALPNAGLANSARIAYLYTQFSGTVNNQDTGAGLQLAIWDVLMDNGDGFAAGNFRASSVASTITQANAYLTASAGHTSTATWYQGLPAGPNEPQGLVGSSPVPEPASITVLGLAAIAAIRRKRRV